jgi:hypothetical protein
LGLPDLEDGDDMWVMDARCQPRLPEEHLDELWLAGQMGVQSLDGDEALESADAREAREVHRGHSTGRQLGHQVEAPQFPLVAVDGE